MYQPPVESDIKTRPSAEKILSQARGIIRHSRVNLASEQQRERRRRVLAGLEPRLRSPPRDAPSGVTGTNDASSGPTDVVAGAGRHSLRDMANRMGILDERVVAMFGERWAHLHADTTPFRELDDDHTPPTLPPISAMAVEPEFFPRLRTPGLPVDRRGLRGNGEPYTISSLRVTQALNRSVRRPPNLVPIVPFLLLTVPQSRSPARSAVRIRRAGRERDMRRRGTSSEGSSAQHQAALLSSDRANRRRGDAQPAPELGQVDGLGDRNRSLSPEGDNVWDTLLSTLTPDPTPPSLGSSFASVSGSAAASQSAATRSSATSFTGPDTIEESAFEQPCESACENSDTEGDEDDEVEQNPLTRFPPARRAERPRSYAEAVSRSSSFDDPLDIISDIRGMQRIVRTLADREDIPDEWWAQVGLSRTLSREASTA